MNPKHPAGPPMTLGNMWALGLRGLNVLCLNSQEQRSTNMATIEAAVDMLMIDMAETPGPRRANEDPVFMRSPAMASEVLTLELEKAPRPSAPFGATQLFWTQEA